MTVAIGLVTTAVFAWLCYLLAFRSEDLPEPSWRTEWLWDLFRSNDGVTGVILCGLGGLVGLWLTLRAGWRFFSTGKAALLTERGLMVHPTYRRTPEIPFSGIQSAAVRRDPYFVHMLYIHLAGARRPVAIRSNEIEGGREALEAFVVELNARRAFEGWNGDRHE